MLGVAVLRGGRRLRISRPWREDGNIRHKLTSTFVRWSEHVPASDVQDPLGLELRASARLGSRLLFCITSVTPRARYFSFIPWCVLDWRTRARGRPFDRGLRDAIVLREKTLTFGSVIHHDGRPCTGGALVGSSRAQRWLERGLKEAELRKLPFAKNPALDVYYRSLVNLGMFNETNDGDEVDEDAEITEATLDDLELSPLGAEIAAAYESAIGRVACVRDLATSRPTCTIRSLADLGRKGGLCELMEPAAPDRQLLRDVFLARIGPTSGSHLMRRQSLMLLLETCRQLSASDLAVSEEAFGQSVYFGQCLADRRDVIDISWPAPLRDVATRWRMFYFHQYMSVALEGLFAWVVTQAAHRGVAGISFVEMVAQLSSEIVRKHLSRLLERPVTASFGDSSPADTLRLADRGFRDLDANASRRLDHTISLRSDFSEDRLEHVIREGTHLHDAAGLAVPMLLLVITLARYTQWEDTGYGQWLANAARDPYLDLLPPVLSSGLTRRFGRWTAHRWSDLARYVLARYVVQQHQSLSFEKTLAGDRCLLQVDGERVMSTGGFDAVGVGNPRFRSALRVLEDLALVESTDDELMEITADGARVLKELLVEAGTP